jgi:uncharacterized repeat protein (TIGR03803 family)
MEPYTGLRTPASSRRFISPGDPEDPFLGPIAQGRDGNLYSTSWSGGTAGGGTTFKITPTGTPTVVYNLDGDTGYAPFGGLTLTTPGRFYGTTTVGGPSLWGTLFSVLPNKNFTRLYAFSNDANGSAPTAPPIQAPDGNLYGTTSASYEDSQGYGTVYRITYSGQFTTIYQFTDSMARWSVAVGPLVLGNDGNLYGTTYIGGTNGFGTVYKIKPNGKLTVLYNFDGVHGIWPAAPLVQGGDGSLYGTTVAGGSNDTGVVFRVTPAGMLTVLHDLDPSTSVGYISGLIEATDGNFYGVASTGGERRATGSCTGLLPMVTSRS